MNKPIMLLYIVNVAAKLVAAFGTRATSGFQWFRPMNCLVKIVCGFKALALLSEMNGQSSLENVAELNLSHFRKSCEHFGGHGSAL